MADNIRKFLRTGGTTCPHCGSENLQESQGIELDGLAAFSEEQCRDCRKYWTVEYTLVVTGVFDGFSWHRKRRGSKVTL